MRPLKHMLSQKPQMYQYSLSIDRNVLVVKDIYLIITF